MDSPETGFAVRIFLTLILSLFGYSVALPALADDGAIVLIYHRFGEATLPETNIRLDQFDAHVSELSNGTYTHLPLPEIANRLSKGELLPARTVAVTVDDGYKSAFEEAWPRLKAAGIPMTVFVSTDAIDAGATNMMSWDQIRKLVSEGVTIGHHTADHLHMVDAGSVTARASIEKSSARFQQELGVVPDLFAYPYGEYSGEMIALVSQMGFRAAFAQYSGVAQTGRDVFALPRFPMNENYADLSRFRLIVNAQALPVKDVLPRDPVVGGSGENPPAYGFTIAETVPSIAAITCFPSHMSEPATVSLIAERRVEVRFETPFPRGRQRINCTMPGPDKRWYWLGKFFYVR